jgi:nucleoside-diphosphate-sugar epimerase
MNILAMGGTRFMGIAVVRRLLDHGHSVTVFNRGTRAVSWPSPVAELKGDRNDPAAVAVLRNLTLDGVVDMSAYTPLQTQNLLAVAGSVPRFVHCSTAGVYTPQLVLPWPEETPYGPWELWGQYAADKIACERVLRAARPERLATTAIRIPYVLGPLNYEDREEFVLNRLLDGGEVLVPGDGQAVQQFVSSEQVAYAMVAALETLAGGGWRAFNIASPGFTSLVGFVQICAEVAGTSARVRCVGGGPTGDGSRSVNRANPLFPFPNVNYVLDLQASIRAGIAPPAVSLASMIDSALEALQARPERRVWMRTSLERAYLP